MSKALIFLATPCYGNMCHVDYLHSVLDCYSNNLSITVVTPGNDSLVCRARNTLISYFYHLQSFTHLFFLDADIKIKGEDVAKLISYNLDVVGAPVALKGKDVKGNSVYNVGKQLSINPDFESLIETDRLGTAVFMLNRVAVNALVEKAIKENQKYKANPHTLGSPLPIPYHYNVFQTGVFSEEYYPEDFYVCKILRDLGFKVWVDTSISVVHNGMSAFE